MSTASSTITALEARVRRDGARPLITYYNLDNGERTELSATTFANWVDKTAGLLDDLGADDPVSLPLLAAHPGHWVSLIWTAACWQVGASVVLDGEGSPVVVGPDDLTARPGADTIACSLHPFALPVPGLPAGLLDYADVRSQPDIHVRLSDEVAQPEVEGAEPTSERRLLVPADAWTTVRAALVAPLLGGGSSVIVVGGDDDARDRVARSERATG